AERAIWAGPNTGEELRAIGVPALRIIALTFPCAAVTIVSGYFASGLGNGVVNMAGGALRQLVPLLPLAWLFTANLGIGCTWYAFWVSEAAAVVYSLLSVRHEMKKKVTPLLS
ncbi:MAG: MATE family efflux transporter, partial [Oscillospiraceae bacterium]|nr:MATE family efflux transporter [Oscillospiraceae bacterium]